MNFSKISLILISFIVLSACTSKTQVITKTIPANIPIVNKPSVPSLISPKIYVVTNNNYEDFVTRFTKANGELVFVGISVKDYENLSINLSEIQSFLKKQNEVIVYYEDSIRANKVNK